jgi:putative redox protein
MTQTLNVTVGDFKGKMQLTGKGHTEARVAIDYPPPLGEDTGFTSLELLMVSLASCSSHSIKYVMSTMGMELQDIKANAVGQRRVDQHPTILTAIELTWEIKGKGLDQAKVEQAVRMAEEKYCPVWAMLKKEVGITWKVVLA